MNCTQAQKDNYIRKLKQSIVELQTIQDIISQKKPSLLFLSTVIGNSGSTMVELLLYLEGKNPYYKDFSQEFYNNRQASMHRTFFSDLHIAVEDGLRQIIKKYKFEIKVNKYVKIQKLIDRINKKIDYSIIQNETKEIIILMGNRPTFNDYLNSVLANIKSLDKGYKTQCRIYFDGISIIRNKVSHSEMTLSEVEKNKLRKAKLGNAIDSNGLLQMTFEGYKLLIADVVRFFDRLYANL